MEATATATKQDGKVVSVDSSTLTTTCSEGKQHKYNFAKDIKVTCDGKDSKAADLKVGSNVRVTTTPDDANTATVIESGKTIAPIVAQKP